MNVDQSLRTAVKQAAEALFGQPLETIQLQPTNAEFEGSHTVVCFPLTKLSRKGPEETARLVGDYLVQHAGIVSKYNVVKGFLNLVLSDQVWVDVLRAIVANPHYGQLPDNGQEIMIEYSSPNTNKPLHLGHLRNNFLGWSVSEIYKNNGYTVRKVQIINDRGIHICKSMAAWKLYGDGETPQSSGMKGDHLVGKYYVLFESQFRKEIGELIDKRNAEQPFIEVMSIFFRENPTATNFVFDYEGDAPFVVERSNTSVQYVEWEALRKILVKTFDDISRLVQGKKKGASLMYEWLKPVLSEETIFTKAQDMLRKWEQKDPDTVALWQTMNGWVYDGFGATYARMGVDFDKLYYESDTYLLGRDEVLRGLEKGIFFKKEDGSVWVDLTADGLDQKVLLRSDGTSVYMTQDIGTAILRFRDFPKITGQVYTVGNEQEYHFKVLFLILGKLGYDWAKRCFHLSYGMVDLPTGKMKSREGTVVDADDLMQEMYEEAEKQTRELGKLEDMSGEEAKRLFNMIGLGALKFFLLKVDPKKRMLFDPQESIQLQGFTGPFVQYTHARIRSILRKADSMGLRVSAADLNSVIALEPAEREALQVLSIFETKVQEAAREYAPSIIANYAYDLAKEYNKFYQSVPILPETDANKLKFRIALSRSIADAIKRAMYMLGIDVPERM
ncbi:arginine--tRNA ligase [Dawidia soli]|uniref:Arginine--tRNA ligase n=1 Tax=Dawidia soli TaxID=2782352 RepID=A0AAP2DEC8_9BACT|nr:arginine--tRNA ligase [Dawidia soli]MBT1687837.1 arginine--tRNA ligase [Dawidia soli]